MEPARGVLLSKLNSELFRAIPTYSDLFRAISTYRFELFELNFELFRLIPGYSEIKKSPAQNIMSPNSNPSLTPRRKDPEAQSFLHLREFRDFALRSGAQFNRKWFYVDLCGLPRQNT